MARAEVEGKPAQWAVKVENHDPDQVAREHGFINLGQVGNLKNYFLFQAEEHQSKREAIEQAAKVRSTLASENLATAPLTKFLPFSNAEAS